MVALSPNFAVLASLSALAATVLAPVNGVAIPSAPHRSQPDRNSDGAAKFDKHRSGSSPSAQGQSASSEADAVDSDLPALPIPLPGLSRRLKYNADGQPLFKRWDPLDPLLQVGDLYIGDNPSHEPAAQSEAFEVASASSRVHTTTERVHTEHHSPEEVVHMIVTGDNENIHMGRSPEPHRHAQPNAKRAPRHHLHHGFHRYHWKRDAPSGKHGNGHEKREAGSFHGVPGIIDIMSSVAGSKTGQRVASLVLAPATNGTSPSEPFVLNASGTNQTQVYLVVLDDGDDSTFNPNRQTSSTTHANSTVPSNSTIPEGSTAPGAQSIDDSTSASLDSSVSITADGSGTPSNSTSTFKKVALQVSVFNQYQADLESYCATFDPQPLQPSPLTVEKCTEGVVESDHKSQVFSYDPMTGFIRPMWFNDADGSADQDSADATQDTSESSSPTSGAAESESAGVDDDIDASADVGAAVTRLNSLNRELIGDASRVHNFAARDTYNAQNVTLKFTPLAPILPQQDIPTEAQAVDPFASSSSSDVSTATDSSSGAIATDSASLTSSIAPSSVSASGFTTASQAMTSAAFSPAAVPSSTPTDAASDSLEASGTNVATSSGAFSSVSVTGSGTALLSATSSATESASTPTSSAHGLGVEVFDPSVQAAGNDADSSSVASSTSQGSATASATSTTSSGSAGAPSMTPMSTAPYNWMFRETTRKN